MFSTARRIVATVAALGALALGGSAIAGAATKSNSVTSSATPAARQGQPPNGGRHVGANGRTEQALTGDTAAKVKGPRSRRCRAARSSASRPTSITAPPMRRT